MTDTLPLRRMLVGLVRVAAMEEELLLMDSGELMGSADVWAAAPTVEHNTRCKREQVVRLQAVRHGVEPPTAHEIDHRSPVVYAELASATEASVQRSRRRVADELVDALSAVADEDLLDPVRHPWLRGRSLWLQVAVRGFWHPLGHLGEFYLEHNAAARALSLHTRAVADAEYLGAPDPVVGMARYSLACVQARADLGPEAVQTLRAAVALNRDLMANAGRDPDLAGIDLDEALGQTAKS